MVSMKPSPGQRRTTNVQILRNRPFFFFFLSAGCGVVTEPKKKTKTKNLFPLHPHKIFRVVSPLSANWWPPSAAQKQPGNRVSFTMPLHRLSQPEEKRGWSAPELCLCLGFISAVATAGPRTQSKLQPQQNAKYKIQMCVRGCGSHQGSCCFRRMCAS